MCHSKFLTLHDRAGKPYTYDTLPKLMEFFGDIGCFAPIASVTKIKDGDGDEQEDAFYQLFYQGGVSSVFQTSAAIAPFKFSTKREKDVENLENLIMKAIVPFSYISPKKYYFTYQPVVSVKPNYALNNLYEYRVAVILFFKCNNSIIQQIYRYLKEVSYYNPEKPDKYPIILKTHLYYIERQHMSF